VATSEYCRPMRKSFTNLPATKCIACAGINVYDVLRHKNLVMTSGAIDELKERL
jgi:ribosomal protein L4